MTDTFTFVDLFAGIGGFRKAFESVGGKCVFTCEWNKYALQTYRANFDTADHPVHEDIRTLREGDIPPHEVLLAGFPCQPFSIAGVSKKVSLNRPHGFLDEAQGTLFFDILRILKKRRPSVVVLENVRNLETHDNGRTFKVIHDSLTDLGYLVQHRIIDASHFVPQHRKRIFIVAFLEGTDFDLDEMPLPGRPVELTVRSILHARGVRPSDDERFTAEDGSPASKYTISDKLWEYLQEYAERQKARGNGFGYGIANLEGITRTLSARYFKDGAEILIPQVGQNPRRLTPRECARLMGFDGPLSSDWIIPVSDAQAYRQFGNAVVVPVVALLARHLVPHIVVEGGFKVTHVQMPLSSPAEKVSA